MLDSPWPIAYLGVIASLSSKPVLGLCPHLPPPQSDWLPSSRGWSEHFLSSCPEMSTQLWWKCPFWNSKHLPWKTGLLASKWAFLSAVQTFLFSWCSCVHHGVHCCWQAWHPLGTLWLSLGLWLCPVSGKMCNPTGQPSQVWGSSLTHSKQCSFTSKAYRSMREFLSL